MFRISFCTTVMNRLNHLKETLPANLHDNKDCADLEFVILDYNSDDGLEEYIYANYHREIDSKRLVYFRSQTSKYFDRSHSRNLAFRLASGQILCNIDADNYTGKGFASYIKNKFDSDRNIFLSTIGAMQVGRRDCLGRICVLKEDFFNVGGFDERMSSYGFEDYDLVNRLSMTGLKNTIITDRSFLTAIEHSNVERLKNEAPVNSVTGIYINYISENHSELLISFNDLKVKTARIQNNRAFNSLSPVNKSLNKYEISVLGNEWISYDSLTHGGQLLLKNGVGSVRTFYIKEDGNLSETDPRGNIFYRIDSQRFLEHVLLFYCETSNRFIMDGNSRNKVICVNPEGFGKDLVFKNSIKDNVVVKV